MLPFHAPAGTTPREYLEKIVPDAHATLVKGAPSGPKPWEISINVRGEGAVRYAIEGGRMSVEPFSADVHPDDLEAHLAIVFEKEHVERFLADWSGARRYVPKFEPRGAALVTDPRVVSRVAAATGSLEAIVPDLEGGPVRIALAAFGGKRGSLAHDAPTDVRLEIPARTFEAMVAGTMGPDDVLASGDVAIKGRKLVAMQLAFAIAPFFPAK